MRSSLSKEPSEGNAAAWLRTMFSVASLAAHLRLPEHKYTILSYETEQLFIDEKAHYIRRVYSGARIRACAALTHRIQRGGFTPFCHPQHHSVTLSKTNTNPTQK